MSTIYGATELRRAATLAGRVANFFKTCRDAFEERRQRRLLRDRLSDLSDRELLDIGISPGEIDYVASHRDIDPRGIRCGDWLRHLPTMDGQIGSTDFR